MAPSKQVRGIRAKPVRIYNGVSEDRMELLLDRLRLSLQQRIDWVGAVSALFTGIASFASLWESWKGSPTQISYLIATVIFVTIVCWRTGDVWLTSRKTHPMTNDEFLSALAEEEEEESEIQKESIDKASMRF